MPFYIVCRSFNEDFVYYYLNKRLYVYCDTNSHSLLFLCIIVHFIFLIAFVVVEQIHSLYGSSCAWPSLLSIRVIRPFVRPPDDYCVVYSNILVFNYRQSLVRRVLLGCFTLINYYSSSRLIDYIDSFRFISR